MAEEKNIFEEYRTDVSYDANKENYYIFNDFALSKGYSSFPAFYKNSKKCLRFRKGSTVRFQPCTLVTSDNVEYTIVDKKKRQKIVVAVTVIDNNNPDFIHLMVQPEGKEGNKFKTLPVKGMTYYVEKNHLHTVDPNRADPPQAKILINPLEGLKSAKSLWYKEQPGTILEDKQNFYIVSEATKSSFKDEQEKRIIAEETKDLAVEHFLKHYDIKETGTLGLTAREIVMQAAKATTFHVSDRPKSKVKILVSIPKQMTPLVEDAESTSTIQHYELSELTLGDLKKHLSTVKNYLLSLNPIVKKENINLNLSKEAENLDLATKAILQVFKFNSIRKAQDTDAIKITWSADFVISGLQIIVKEDLTESIQAGTPTSKQDSLEGKEYMIPFKSKFTHRIFTNPRTMLFLINIDLMAQSIGKQTNASLNKLKWFDFLRTYVHKMPEYRPSAKLNYTDEAKSAKDILTSVQKMLTQGSTFESKQAALEALSPIVRASIGEAQRTLFEKIEDPTLKLIIENIDKINSLDSLYDMVLSKIPPERLFQMARDGVGSSTSSGKFFNSLSETAVNLESSDLSDEALKHFSIDSLSDRDTLFTDFGKTGQSLMEGFKMDIFSDDEEIFDITGGATENTFGEIHDMISQGLIDVFKEILQAVKNSYLGETEKQKAEAIGTFDIQESLKGKQFEGIKSKINSFPNVYLEDEDLADILKIISDLATPHEILAIFQGSGDSEVIDIIGTEIVNQFPILEDVLDTIYEKEDFLMTIGEVILPTVTTAIGDHILEKEKSEYQEEVDSFCDPHEVAMLANHLTDRFPENFAQSMATQQSNADASLLSFLDSMEAAMENNNLAGFLFGGKINDLINDLSHKNPSSNLAKDMVVESFFNPIISIFDVESLEAGEHFTTISSIPDNSDRPLDPTVSLQITRLKTEAALKDEDSDERKKLLALAESIEEKATSKKKKLALVLNDEVASLHSTLEKNPAKISRQEDKLVCQIGTDDRRVELRYSTIPDKVSPEQPPKSVDPQKSAMNPAEDKGGFNSATGDVDSGILRLRAIVTEDNEERVLIDSEDTLNFPEWEIKDLIDTTDVGYTPQCSAYATIIKNILKEKVSFYTEGMFPNEEGDPTTEDLKAVLQDIKDYMYDFTNERLCNLVALNASKSSFFDVTNLQKLKFSPTDGDMREAPLLCDQVETEEANKLQTEEDELIPQILLMDDILDRVRDRETYFSILEREERGKIFDRTAMENALIMELTEIFFKAIVLEFLISGIFIFGEVNCDTLIKDKNNFKIIQKVIFSTMETLGQAFKNNFSTYLSEYAEIRLGVDGDEEDAAINPMPADISPTDLESIVNFILLEQMEEVYESYQKAVHALSANQKLEVNEILDLIPNIDIARSSKGEDYRFVMPINDNIRKEGGFVLEKYIRVNYAPSVENESLSEFLIGRKDKIKIPSYDPLTGEFEWIHSSGDKGAVLSKLLTEFLQKNAEPTSQFIQEIKKAHQAGEEGYDEYFKKTHLYGNSLMTPLKSTEEIFDIMMGKFEFFGKEFLETLPGYTDYVDQINSFTTSLEGEDFLYTFPNYLGLVELDAFKEMQEYITFVINASYDDKVDSALDQYNTLQDKFSAIQTYEAQLEDYYKEWNALEKILYEDIEKYTQKYKNPISLKDPYNDGTINVASSDFFLYQWVEGTKSKLLGYKIDRALETIFLHSYGDELMEQDDKLKKFAEEYGTTVESVDEGILGDIVVKGYSEAIGAYLRSLSEEDLMDFLSNLEYSGEIKKHMRLAYESLLEDLNVLLTDILQYFIGALMTQIQYIQKILAQGYLGDPDDSIKIYHNPEDIAIYEKEWSDYQERLDMLKSFKLEKQKNDLAKISDKIKDKQQDMDLLLEGKFPFDMKQFFESEIAAAEAAQDSAKYYQDKFSIHGPHTKYFEPLKYGIRLCYVYPEGEEQSFFQNWLTVPDIEDEIKARLNKITGKPSDSYNYSDKALNIDTYRRRREQTPYDSWWMGEFVDPTVYDKFTLNMIPLIEIEDDVDKYFPEVEKEKPNSINDNRDDSGRASFAGIPITNDKIVSSFPLKELKNKMINTPSFRQLFSEVFMYSDLTNALAIFSSMHVIEEFYKRQSLGIFSGTKVNIKDIFNNVFKATDFEDY